jgi:hypothetical protein
VPNKRSAERAAVSASQKPRISQSDVPSMSLEKALKVPRAIAESYGFKPATPLQVGSALELQPSTGGFRMLTGAAIAYGLTIGGAFADQIEMSPLAMRIFRSTVEGDDLVAKREAVLKPRVIREFLLRYDGATLPKPEIARNVLLEMGVPRERTKEILDLILESANSVGFIREINGRKYVDTKSTSVSSASNGNASPAEESLEELQVPAGAKPTTPIELALPPATADKRLRRVFITHGKNQKLIEPIKKLLSFGELEPVVSVQTQTVSQPVPSKVLGEMRSCGAAIIHVEDERTLVDANGNQHVVLNDNVLIEIGAAMALYGDRFILVTHDGVKLPSNLQGLLELRYKGDTLDMEETVKLLEAINDMKKRSLP